MALQTLPWLNESWMTERPPIIVIPGFTSLLLDASADRVVFAGRFRHKDRATKTVDGIGFLLGAISKANGSTLQCSLQDVSLTAGPPLREDGTPDQTLTIANADAGFATNLWYEGAFDGGATRSLTPGDLVAVVLQFASFVAGDTVNIRGVSGSGAGVMSAQGATVTNLTGTYAAQTVLPNVAFRCTDGSYGTLEGGFVCSAITGQAVASNTAGADEYALAFQYPMPVKLDGLWTIMGLTTAGDNTELLLYSGTTALVTVNIDHNAVVSATRVYEAPCAEQTLSANTLYRVAIRPLNTNAITLYFFDVAFVNHLQCHPGGVNAHLWTRVDQGAWGGEVTTRRLLAGVRLSAFDDGAGGGQGPLVGPGRLVRS